MTQHDVLELFRERAEMLGEVPTSQSDIIQRLARLLAASRENMSKEDFDELTEIGAVMYQEFRGKVRARSEVAATMEESHKDRKHS